MTYETFLHLSRKKCFISSHVENFLVYSFPFRIGSEACFGRLSERERTLSGDELRNEIGEHVERGTRVAIPKTNIARTVASAGSAQPSRAKGILVAARCLFGRVVLADWNHNEKPLQRVQQHLVRHLFSPHPSTLHLQSQQAE